MRLTEKLRTVSRQQGVGERLRRYTRYGPGCWEWTGAKHKNGYGAFRLFRRSELAHRVSYALVKGVIPSHLNVCHKCDNPACVRPEHLFLGTDSDNRKDALAKKRVGSGHSNCNAKLKAGDAGRIRWLYVNRGMFGKALAAVFRVTPATIYHILRGERYLKG